MLRIHGRQILFKNELVLPTFRMTFAYILFACCGRNCEFHWQCNYFTEFINTESRHDRCSHSMHAKRTFCFTTYKHNFFLTINTTRFHFFIVFVVQKVIKSSESLGLSSAIVDHGSSQLTGDISPLKLQSSWPEFKVWWNAFYWIWPAGQS